MNEKKLPQWHLRWGRTRGNFFFLPTLHLYWDTVYVDLSLVWLCFEIYLEYSIDR